MFIKVCGIKNLESAKAAAKAGADFLGFNFVPSSRRCVTEGKAKEIIAALGEPRPRLVGVFEDQPIAFVNETAQRLDLDFVQLHGDESPEYCAFINRPVIKAFSVESDFDPGALMKTMAPYRAHYFMLDRKGRIGEPLNFKKVAVVAEEFSVMLAGGLTPENVREAVREAGRIDAVDVAGGVETNGEKDPHKIQAFIRKAKA
jgi:phosphoribosylanthranilate isomerase